MPSFTVHVPQDGDDAFHRADRVAFVRDGFSVWAFLFGPLALLRWRAWEAAATWVVVVLGGAWACHLLKLPPVAQAGLLLLVALFTGLEAASFRRTALERRGLPMADVVEGASRGEGERAFFRAAVAGGLPARVTVLGRPGSRDEEVIGFFPDAGGGR